MYRFYFASKHTHACVYVVLVHHSQITTVSDTGTSGTAISTTPTTSNALSIAVDFILNSAQNKPVGGIGQSPVFKSCRSLENNSTLPSPHYPITKISVTLYTDFLNNRLIIHIFIIVRYL